MYKRNLEIFAAKIDEEIVMMDEKLGLYFGLNPLAAKIWSWLEVPMNLQMLLEKVLDQYEVSPEICRRDLTFFLNEMCAHQLIVA